MAISEPKYISDADIKDENIRYHWDDWNIKAYYMSTPDELFDRLTDLTLRAKIALTTACAEWLVFRFKGISDDPLPLKYLEAAWCGNVDLRYIKYTELNDEEWLGPIRGPLQLAIAIINDIFFCSDDNPEPALNSGWMSTLTQHILPNPAFFCQWRDKCIERLKRLYTDKSDPFDNLFGEDNGGPYVPREVFDLDYDFKPEITNTLINDYLRNVDYTLNQFLHTPNEMLALGFKGKPYSLSV